MKIENSIAKVKKKKLVALHLNHRYRVCYDELFEVGCSFLRVI